MSAINHNRRQFVRDLGVSVAALPFVAGLSSLARASSGSPAHPPKRLIIIFSPNGTLPKEFWPESLGAEHDLVLGDMLAPLQPFRDQMLLLKGVDNKIGGDGDGHQRGMSCLLTAIELNRGNIQGGSHTPAGWATGISIDQQMRNFFQANQATRTRFGSLEFGVAVPNRADPWTRMCYAGNNQPVAPVDDPQQMLDKIYGDRRGRQRLGSILDYVRDDLRRARAVLSVEDRDLLDQHMQQVRQLERDIKVSQSPRDLQHPEPEIDPDVELVNDNTPEVSRMQIDLLVSALANDMMRVATLQYMRSVGSARMRWLDVEEGHHQLSHEPDDNQDAYDKLKRINNWFASEVAYLAGKLADTPEPGGRGGSMLDHTQIVWANELGKGNSHTRDNIPWLLIGGGAGFATGKALDMGGVPHNRFWLSVAHGMGDTALATFGTKKYCSDGPLSLS